MNEVMKKVNELFEILVQANAKAVSTEASLDARKLEQDRVDEQQVAIKEDLVEREAEVAKVESVVELKKKIERKSAELSNKQTVFDAEKAAHKTFVAKERRDIEDIKRDTESIKKALLKKQIDLRAEIKAEILATLKK